MHPSVASKSGAEFISGGPDHLSFVDTPLPPVYPQEEFRT